MSNTEDILRDHKLKVTPSRKKVLDIFLEKNYAISHADIEERLNEIDKVTLYRTLNIFEEKGIIHVAQTETDAKRYALCKESCSTEQHDHNHLHFHCKNCDKTYCLPIDVDNKIQTPQGFTADEKIVLVKGVCDICNQ